MGSWRRTWSVVVVLMSMLAVSVSACAQDCAEWRSFPTATGNYAAEFPSEPPRQTMPIPDTDSSSQMTSVEFGGSFFVITETDLKNLVTYPLDESVDRSIEGANWESEFGTSVTSREISRTTGTFEGVESREFTARLNEQGKYWSVASRLFYRDGVLVQALVITDGVDSAGTDRFLPSPRSNVTSNLL